MYELGGVHQLKRFHNSVSNYIPGVLGWCRKELQCEGHMGAHHIFMINGVLKRLCASKDVVPLVCPILVLSEETAECMLAALTRALPHIMGRVAQPDGDRLLILVLPLLSLFHMFYNKDFYSWNFLKILSPKRTPNCGLTLFSTLSLMCDQLLDAS
eukprot:6492744-Amphidinium_carterae.4